MPFPVTDFNSKPLPDFKAGEEKPVVEPVRNFSNLDELIEEFNIPKEVITNTGPTIPGQKTENPAGLTEFEPERSQMSRDEALKAGKITARAIDTALSFGLSLYANEKEDIKKYSADPDEKNYLDEACSDVSEAYNFKMSPIPTLIMVILFIYGPKLYTAKDDRWKNEIKKRQEIQEKKQDDNEKKIEELNNRVLELSKKDERKD